MNHRILVEKNDGLYLSLMKNTIKQIWIRIHLESWGIFLGKYKHNEVQCRPQYLLYRYVENILSLNWFLPQASGSSYWLLNAFLENQVTNDL